MSFEEYLTICRDYDKPEFFDCLDDLDLKNAYQAGWNARKAVDIEIAENDESDCEHAEHHCGCVAGNYIADAIREKEQMMEDQIIFMLYMITGGVFFLVGAKIAELFDK